jgi:GMP synthase-like glutamine amidotransferase
MILFLDIEHPRAYDDPAYKTDRARTMARRQALFAELSGEECLTRHYSEFRPEELESPAVTALVTSGNRSLWQDYDVPNDFRTFHAALQTTGKPVLGICGGHQLISLLLGGDARPLRRLREGEQDVHPEYAPGWLKEWGYYGLECDAADPLFRGLPSPMVVTQYHFWEVGRMPEGFRSVAKNENCAVQAMRHQSRPIYGVQFHPEFHDPQHLDGRTLLRNFFSLRQS